MGEAKRRGTYEERKALAEKGRIDREHVVIPKRKTSSRLLLATLAAMAFTDVAPRKVVSE